MLPDVSETKARALEALSGSGLGVRVLVSYTTLTWKPGGLSRLRGLVEGGVVAGVMLDSGAYHAMALGVRVDVGEYARLALAAGVPWELVAAPDIPGDPGATLARTREFMEAYPREFLPVLQGQSVEGYLGSLNDLERIGAVERAPRLPRGVRLLGIGGLDGERSRAGFIARLLEALPEGYMFHLFGVGARTLRALSRRGLLWRVYSIDSGGWLAEIRYRRRTIHRARGTLEANIAAMRSYIERIRGALHARA